MKLARIIKEHNLTVVKDPKLDACIGMAYGEHHVAQNLEGHEVIIEPDYVPLFTHEQETYYLARATVIQLY